MLKFNVTFILIFIVKVFFVEKGGIMFFLCISTILLRMYCL